jgi:hypothetical protein
VKDRVSPEPGVRAVKRAKTAGVYKVDRALMRDRARADRRSWKAMQDLFAEIFQ